MQSPEPPQLRKPKGGLLRGSIAAGVLGVLSKGKGAWLLLKALPFGKVLITGGSLVASVFAYAMRGGFLWAIGFVLMILLHELGHGYAMKRAGIASGWPIFIPFFGAMIAMKDRPSHPRIEAEIAYAGPVAGTAGALCAAAIGLLLESPLWVSLAYTGFFLNLFNLMPIGFLDGGRIARLLSRKAWIAGACLLGGLFVVSPTPQLFVITAMSALHVFRRDDADLEAVTASDRRTWALRYFGLCAFLGAAVLMSHRLVEQRTGM